MSNTGEMRCMLRRARDQGWEVDDSSKHLKLRHPSVAKYVVLPKTPSDHRSIKNAEAALRRALRA